MGHVIHVNMSCLTHMNLSVLQRVAACCSMLQCVAVCCNTHHTRMTIRVTYLYSVSVLQRVAEFPCVAVCCSVLQCVAVCCSVLQCVAVCYSTHHTRMTISVTHRHGVSVLQCGSVLQRVAVCCSVLQYVAVCCSVL